MYEHCSLLSHILSPTASSVTTFMLSKAGDNEAGVVRMAVFGLLSLQIFVPRQFARVCHSVNMEWGVKENHVVRNGSSSRTQFCLKGQGNSGVAAGEPPGLRQCLRLAFWECRP